MEFNNKLPIYLQIVEMMIIDIINGKYKSGSKIPSVRETAINYIVNPNTVMNSYEILESKGIIEVRRGLGYFVVDDVKVIKKLKVEKIKEITENYIDDMKKYNLSNEEIIDYLKEIINVRDQKFK